jgi:hypothetical protein
MRISCVWFAILAGCAAIGAGEPNQRHGIALALANQGRSDIDCRLRYGHWVDRDLGTIAPGAQIAFLVSQDDSDGALYVMRDDGQRRMMIETIQCGRSANWFDSFGQVDLGPARRTRPSAIMASCEAPSAGGRVQCGQIQLKN